MRQLLENLFTLQHLTLHAECSPADRRTEIERLRNLAPAPVLAHFDRLVSRGKHSVALVRHGVCGECHLRIPSGTLASLVAPRDLHLCDSCGCYLLLPVEEIPAPAAGHSGRTANASAKRRPRPVAAPADVAQ